MQNNLKLVEGFGWELTLKTPPKNCFYCGEDLKVPFFWCKQFQKAICRTCEKIHFCTTMEMQHEHFNIIKINDGS